MITFKPAISDRVISITIPKTIDPYFMEFFQSDKLPSETVSQFALRILKQISIEKYANKQISIANEASRSTQDTLLAEVEALKKV